MQREKIIVVLTVLVDVIGFGIVIPILPFYVSSFGASPFTITLLFSVFAFFAFLSGPFLGAWSDRIGRRPVLLLSIASTAIGWFVFAAADSIPLLFLGRIIDGAAAGNFTVAQSCLVDIARDEKERASNLGLVGAAFGIGFLVGPLLGGLLSSVSVAFPFWCAGMLATANAAAAYLFLPETHSRRDPQAALTFNPLRPLARAARDVQLRPLFLRWGTFGFAFAGSQSVFALFAERSFGFTSVTTGLLFTLTGVFTALNQTVLLKRFWLKRFSEQQLERQHLAGLVICLILFSTQVLPLFYLAIPLLAISQSILRVAITSQVVGGADPRRKGEILGITASLLAASMVVAPIVAGFLFEIHESLPYIFSAMLAAGATANSVGLIGPFAPVSPPESRSPS
jgi:MFS family permease